METDEFIETDVINYSEAITKAKAFPNEADARAWRKTEVAELTAKGYSILDDVFDLPEVEQLREDRWLAYIEAEIVQLETTQ